MGNTTGNAQRNALGNVSGSSLQDVSRNAIENASRNISYGWHEELLSTTICFYKHRVLSGIDKKE